ncbi:M23 family metallopeptidase [Anaerotalea alkaliphila]|uniref:M23 family metallopeptidase n=1 Tax=Anaerotalea alkaliphila TaxID=2662126 RepID=A0A7X5HWK7_9FIRM|nr:M23 family metallopeptidase [Anaerotalea alkaliphila]NDL68004.1 M23 family metallopeptidase [Anaerotalea alkaliphila]
MIQFERWPTDSHRITSPYGVRTLRGVRQFHSGTDIGGMRAGVAGDKLYAVADGTVIVSKINGGGVHTGFGYYICIQHDGFIALYAHMKALGLPVGTKVRAGDVVGFMGNTGNSTAVHLHFQVYQGSKVHFTKDSSGKVDGVVNPEPYLVDIDNRRVVIKVVDVQQTSDWAKEAQAWVRQTGISDGERPKDAVTREELWTMLQRAAQVIGTK